jgi:SAM-dependent methyltransferase
MTANCPLTHSENVTLIEEIQVSDIAELYKNMYDCSVLPDFGLIQTIGFYYSTESHLKFFYPLVTGSELFYEDLQKFDWYYTDDKEEFNIAQKYIKENDVILEIGCGKGAFAKKINAKKYIGLEFNQKAITQATTNGIKVIQKSIQDHAKDHAMSYDIVCSFQVLEHVADINSFIESSIKCLKPGGLLIYSVPSADSYISKTTNCILNMPPHHVSWWSRKSLEYVGKLFNLDVVDIHQNKLEDIHKLPYISTLIATSIEHHIGAGNKQKKLIDKSIKHKIIGKISTLGGQLLKNGLSDTNVLPPGHTITAIYRKPLQ